MQGNFVYSNPTKLYFGENAMQNLVDELKNYGPTVLLTYGGGSVKQNGIYDQTIAALQQAGKTVVELPGVMPNPTLSKLREGAELARKHDVDLILAVGGGSTIDYAKGVAASAWCTCDPWEHYYQKQRDPECRVIPVGCILTMVGTGSEMNGGSVITNTQTRMKIGKVFGEELFPRFAILNPRFTFSVPHYQMVAGCFDIMSHILEQYFSDADDCTTDYIAEGLMRSLVRSSRVAAKDSQNYEARSNIMWTATWALNTLLKKGKTTDWMVHMIGQAMGAHTNATHGMTLAAVSLPYYRHIMPHGLHRFARFAQYVWGISPDGKTEQQLAEAGLQAMEEWMRDLGLVMHSAELGVKPDMLNAIADSTIILRGGYKVLSHDDVVEILRQSL